MRYGWSVTFKDSRFGDLVEITSDNSDAPDEKGLTVYMRHDPEKLDILWCDPTIEGAYDRAIRDAEVLVRILELDKRKYLKPVDVDVVREALDSLSIGTINTPLADIKVLP